MSGGGRWLTALSDVCRECTEGFLSTAGVKDGRLEDPPFMEIVALEEMDCFR